MHMILVRYSVQVQKAVIDDVFAAIHRHGNYHIEIADMHPQTA